MDAAKRHPFGLVTAVTNGATIGDMEMTKAETLDQISRDLDTTGDAWVAAGYPYDGPEWEAREAVYARLHAWNQANA